MGKTTKIEKLRTEKVQRVNSDIAVVEDKWANFRDEEPDHRVHDELHWKVCVIRYGVMRHNLKQIISSAIQEPSNY